MQSLNNAHAHSTRSHLTGLVGNPPLLRISEPFTPPGRGFWAKLEGFNPSGIKDRPGLHMVERARACGGPRPGGRIIESTSGTLGPGLALAGLVYGHPATLVTARPRTVHDQAPHGLRCRGRPRRRPPTGGRQQARRDRVRHLLARQPDSWCPDQYNNPDNTSAYTPLAVELAADLHHIDVLVCSVMEPLMTCSPASSAWSNSSPTDPWWRSSGTPATRASAL
jgi:cysteine synthase A